MKKELIMLCLGLFVITGCLQNTECSEYDYWEKSSNEQPYPGINCQNGPLKTVGTTFFVYKDYQNVDYISSENSIERGLQLINSVWNPHGINFKLDEIIYVDSKFPSPNEVQGDDGETTIEYGEAVPNSALGPEFENGYNPKNVNIILLADGWGAYSLYPWAKTGHHTTKVRASTLETSFIPAHELGHFLGLYHTHDNSQSLEEDYTGLSKVQNGFSISGPPNWATDAQDCYLNGDYICDTHYDCYNFCEEMLGCSGKYLYENEKPGKEQSNYPDCDSSYQPPLYNLMSRYGGREFITSQQGARARYYLNYRLNNELYGNVLEEIGEY